MGSKKPILPARVDIRRSAEEGRYADGGLAGHDAFEDVVELGDSGSGTENLLHKRGGLAPDDDDLSLLTGKDARAIVDVAQQVGGVNFTRLLFARQLKAAGEVGFDDVDGESHLSGQVVTVRNGVQVVSARALRNWSKK